MSSIRATTKWLMATHLFQQAGGNLGINLVLTVSCGRRREQVAGCFW